jgi:hypothetical protein
MEHMDFAHEDLIKYVYFVDDRPHLGTIKDIARALESEYYGAIDVARVVYTFANRTPKVSMIVTEQSEFDEEDFAVVTVSINNDTTTYRVDGRA